MPTAPKPFRARPLAVSPVVDLDRGSARERGYTPAWDKAAAAHRAEHPLCVYCAKGVFGPRRDTPAQCVDHLYPHRRYPGVFWQTVYWISACDDCHDGPKQAVEHAGREALDRLARRLGLAPLTL
jgi:5-methylcytosine-specific restriction protein A